jgi:hypothetical protein
VAKPAAIVAAPSAQAAAPAPRRPTGQQAPRTPEEAFGLRASDQMSQDYLDELDEQSSGPRRWPWLVAAAVIVIAVGAFVASRSSTPPVDSQVTSVAPAPRAAPPANPSPAPAPRSPVAAPEPVASPEPKVPEPPIPTREPPSRSEALKRQDPEPKRAEAAGDDSDAEKIIARGNALYKRGNVKAAITELKKAVELDDGNDKAHTLLGTAYFDADQSQLAITHLKKAIGLNPKNGQALVVLGNVYQAVGDNGRAKETYKTYLALEPHGKFADDVKMIMEALP